jgi:hypothetical protein
LSDEILMRSCAWGRSRASGPGGQHRNKVETLVWITHTPSGIEAHAGERRSAQENKSVATFRLRLALATNLRVSLPPGNSWGDARSPLWRSRCPANKISCNPAHRDFPSLLAEALDTIAACDFDEGKAAARLACTVSQLVRFVKDHPPAFAAWNHQRAQRGQHALR